MYIRKTQHQKKKIGGYYFTYRLVNSQRTLLNLDTDFSLTKEQWPILTKRISEILTGQQSLFAIDCKLNKLTGNYAARIIKRQQDENDGGGTYSEVDLDSLEMSRPRIVGCEHVTLEALRLLGLDSKLEELGFTGPQVSLAIGTIIGRACHPASERETHRWLQDQSGLGELLDYNFEESKLYKMYQISDQLLKKKSALKEHLYQREKNIFSLNEKITLYDLTNTYFEGNCLGNSFAKRGHSQEKRSDCPLVTLGLVLDSSGFLKRSHVYEGNVSEPATLSEMVHDLQSSDISADQKPTVVMDAGLTTQDNIDWLKDHHYPYVVVSRKKHRQFDESESTIVKQDAECTVKVQNDIDNETGETRLYCHSSQREKKERAIGSLFPEDLKMPCMWLMDCLSRDD